MMSAAISRCFFPNDCVDIALNFSCIVSGLLTHNNIRYQEKLHSAPDRHGDAQPHGPLARSRLARSHPGRHRDPGQLRLRTRFCGDAALGSGPTNRTVEALEWRTDRADRRAGKAGCLSKRLSGRDGSHSSVPQGFGKNGPELRLEGLKYRHIPAPSFLALSHFYSNLDRPISRP